MNSPAWKFDTPLEQAGLTHSVHKADGFELGLLTSISLLRLHSLQTLAELDTSLHGSDLNLPQLPNQAGGQDPAVLCLAPNDWLLFSEYLSAERLQEMLQERLNPQLTILSNQSSAYAAFRLSGRIAPWLLSKSCGLDFRKGMALGQHCSRTGIGQGLNKVSAILHYHQPGSGHNPYVFDVMTERSLAHYVWQLFLRQLPHAIESEQRHGPFYEQGELHP